MVKKEFARVLFMLFVLSIIALWIQANTDFKAGSIYIGMAVIGIFGYTQWDAITGRGD